MPPFWVILLRVNSVSPSKQNDVLLYFLLYYFCTETIACSGSSIVTLRMRISQKFSSKFVLRTKDEKKRLAPLFKNGLSFSMLFLNLIPDCPLLSKSANFILIPIVIVFKIIKNGEAPNNFRKIGLK